jgi:hypothetical protein
MLPEPTKSTATVSTVHLPGSRHEDCGSGDRPGRGTAHAKTTCDTEINSGAATDSGHARTTTNMLAETKVR